MRNFRLLAVGIGGVLGVVGLLNGPALAQQESGPQDPVINPLIKDCNVIPDTNQPTKPTKPTPITPDLLTSGQPCQQIVSGNGLVDGSADGAVLANRQRGFDFYSWLTFIAMNSPADGKAIGKGPRPGGDDTTTWESLRNYRPLADVMLSNGDKPTWGTRNVPELCKQLDGDGKKIVFQLGEEAFNQPFKTGPLIDQDGNFALFDILMNKPMFDFIVKHDLYSKAGQQKLDETQFQLKRIEFPLGILDPANPTLPPGTRIFPGHMGAIMLKVSYRILDPVKDKELLSQFHTSDALIYFPGPTPTGGGTKTGPACVEKKLGLVGFHVGHKTNFAPQWVWTSFEHASNVPDAIDVGTAKLLSRYNFFSAKCGKNCPATNDVPPQPWDPDTTLKFHGDYRSQVVRDQMVPEPVQSEVTALNDAFHTLLKGTVWENYMLLTTQWPSDFANPTNPLGSPAPTYLANTTLETYSQGRIPLASSSCMACHGNATTHHVPATASDFTFILEKAQ